MSATLAPPPRPPAPAESNPVPAGPPTFHRDRPTFMTRAEWERFSETAARPHEWLGTQPPGRIDDDAMGEVRPVHGYNGDGTPAMATRRHSMLAMNTSGILWSILPEEYVVHSQGLAVRDPLGPYYYPDTLISPYPGTFEPHPHGEELYLVDPLVVIEMLSRSTARTDRIEKRAAYLRMSAVTVYLIVEQDRPRVTHLRRIAGDAGDRWDETTADGLDATVTLAAPAATLPLAEVYRRVL